MKKNIILLTIGVGDFFFSPSHNSKVANQKEFVGKVEALLKRNTYKCVVNVSTPNDSTDNVNVFESLRPQSVVKLVVHADQLLHPTNELSLLSLDNEVLLFNGNEFDHLLRPQDYDIHICGIDINGIFSTAISELIAKGYNVTLYSDAIKPFKNTYKFISSLDKNKKFQYCSYKAT
jgi:hypothetical protein